MSSVLLSSSFLAAILSLRPQPERVKLASDLLTFAGAIDQRPALFQALMEIEFAQHSPENVVVHFLRSNSVASKCLDFLMERMGREFFKEVLGEVVASIVEADTLELDPLAEDGPGSEDSSSGAEPIPCDEGLAEVLGVRWAVQGRRAARLCDIVGACVAGITCGEAEAAAPSDLRKAAGFVKNLAVTAGVQPNSPIATMVMLRLLNPSIVSPQRWGFNMEEVTSQGRRNLLMVSKVVQKLSNQALFDDGKVFLQPLNPFLTAVQPLVDQWLLRFANADEACGQPSQPPSREESAAAAEALRGILVASRGGLLEALQRLAPDKDNVKTLDAAIQETENWELQQPLPSRSEESPSLSESFEETTGSSGVTPPPSLDGESMKPSHRHIRAPRPEIPLNGSEPAAVHFPSLLRVAGRTSDGRGVLQIFGNSPPGPDHQATLGSADELVEHPYVLIHCQVRRSGSSGGQPPIRWLLDFYRGSLERKYKKNIVALYLLHPSAWIRLLMKVVRPVVSPKFWVKLHHASSLDDLAKEADVPLGMLAFPPDVILYDLVECQRLKPTKGGCCGDESAEWEDRFPPPAAHRFFGVPLEEAAARCYCGTSGYPAPIADAFQFLHVTRAFSMDSIFRRSGAAKDVGMLRAVSQHGYRVCFSGVVSPYTVASYVKEYLRTIPNGGIFGAQCREAALALFATSGQDQDCAAVSAVLSDLPTPSLSLLRDLLGFLRLVADHSEESHMDPSAVATCIALALFPVADQEQSETSPLGKGLIEQRRSSAFCYHLLQNYHTLFPPSLMLTSTSPRNSPLMFRG
eukprot:NODE_225_length_2664_cov_26.293308_g207_i0.p1 GENE.NODE_225_length_2664_cov_26.293308_g207_i0~~NODE_225_length_2664_cov_26.293308_g207_i0.p1  ORF type:complete len:804 (+),score=140.83 NODE_225_length_2664_cov_26.293308_g207_i0:164-2575(+)